MRTFFHLLCLYLGRRRSIRYAVAEASRAFRAAGHL